MRKGFTFIEVMIAIMIFVILGSDIVKETE